MAASAHEALIVRGALLTHGAAQGSRPAPISHGANMKIRSGGKTSMTCRASIFTAVTALVASSAQPARAAGVYAWGYNENGQVGDGTSGSGNIQTTPVATSGMGS